MIFVDTGAWFASVITSDLNHSAAVAWLDSNTGPLLATEISLSCPLKSCIWVWLKTFLSSCELLPDVIEPLANRRELRVQTDKLISRRGTEV